jgi:membrane peptidoglycan carboxypeptidase
MTNITLITNKEWCCNFTSSPPNLFTSSPLHCSYNNTHHDQNQHGNALKSPNSSAPQIWKTTMSKNSLQTSRSETHAIDLKHPQTIKTTPPSGKGRCWENQTAAKQREPAKVERSKSDHQDHHENSGDDLDKSGADGNRLSSHHHRPSLHRKGTFWMKRSVDLESF